MYSFVFLKPFEHNTNISKFVYIVNALVIKSKSKTSSLAAEDNPSIFGGFVDLSHKQVTAIRADWMLGIIIIAFIPPKFTSSK